MVKIGIITGSTRDSRVNIQVAEWVKSIADKKTDAEFELVDIKDYNLPRYNEPVPAIGYSIEEIEKLKIREFPLDERVFVRDFGETSAREMIEEVVQEDDFSGFSIVVFWKKAENDYYENWHSHFEIEEPTD